MSAKPRRIRGTKEMSSCLQVMRVLQSYLDGQTDEVTTRRVANHLEACRRCGLEAATYREIKAALARRAAPAPTDQHVLERLRAFGTALTARSGDEDDSGQAQPPA
jgi:anti-sigma factor (TIGR02949 family)